MSGLDSGPSGAVGAGDAAAWEKFGKIWTKSERIWANLSEIWANFGQI